jgi:hypothetical protein
MPPYGTTAAAEEVVTQRRVEAEDKRIAEGGRKSGKTREPPSEEPDPNDGYKGWNAQAAVDARRKSSFAHRRMAVLHYRQSTGEVSGRRRRMRSSHGSMLS